MIRESYELKALDIVPSFVGLAKTPPVDYIEIEVSRAFAGNLLHKLIDCWEHEGPISLDFYGDIKQLDSIVPQLKAEIERLKRGDFTPEEFQNLCHHRDEKAGCTRSDFEAGCIEYQNKLFGHEEGETNGGNMDS